MGNIFEIHFSDLSFEKQQDILETLKKYELEKLKQEAKEKNKSLKQLLWEDYLIDDDLSDKDKEKYFKLTLDEYLEELVEKRIKNFYFQIEI